LEGRIPFGLVLRGDLWGFVVITVVLSKVSFVIATVLSLVYSIIISVEGV